jgi:AhpD family alkylhydroperoxidase
MSKINARNIFGEHIIERTIFGGLMEARYNAMKLSEGGYKAMLGLEQYIRNCGLEHGLLHMIKLRASQINGCAYCIDMHWKDARALGETEQRLYGLSAWRESGYYTARERAALEWTEAVTLITQGHVADDVYERVRQHLSEKEVSDLTVAIATINAWNRVVVSSRTVPGSYQPAKH